MAEYNSILNAMKNAYFDECGEAPDMYGDDGLLLKTVATELYNLALEAEYAVKQSSYKTATGDSLDKIAAECSLHRKQGSFATGVLSFSIDEAASEDILIGKGTICAKKNERFIQYKTTEDCIIKAGELSAQARCVALKKGFEYNAAPGEVAVMINPPQKVQRVANLYRITDGYNKEDDAVLRARIENAIKCPHNSLNEEHLKSMICDIDDVLDFKMENGEYVVSAFVKTYSGTLSEETSNKIYDILSFVHLMGAYLSIEASIPLCMDIKLSYYGVADEEEIKNKCCAYIESLPLGETPDERGLSDFICRNVSGVQYVDALFDNCYYIMARNYYVIGSLEVGAYEG